MINWDDIISDLLTKDGNPITTDPDIWHLDTPGYDEIYNAWKAANFNLATIKWINYYPGKHFSKDIVEEVAQQLGLKGIHRSWISRIDPGYMAPWHWDVDENEQEYLVHGPIIRYTVIIKEFAHGHIFIIGDKYFYNLYKGKSICWDNYREWHSGINAGMEPNWLLHIVGYN